MDRNPGQSLNRSQGLCGGEMDTHAFTRPTHYHESVCKIWRQTDMGNDYVMEDLLDEVVVDANEKSAIEAKSL